MTLWGGRFEGSPAEGTWAFTTDDSDRRLLEFDVEGSIAHAEMLGETGIITADEAAAIAAGLTTILGEARGDTFEFAPTDEDVHSAVERRLGELVGDVAGKLHSGRSRNDQVALDLRLYLTRAADARVSQLRVQAEMLVGLAEIHSKTVIPSYTHLQQAQPTTLGHHLLAYAWMALRAIHRLEDARRRIATSPLGAGASSGSSLPLDRDRAARGVGFDAVMENSLDAVGSRDFVAEYVFCCAQTMVDLSRLSEEIVLWSTKEFGWVSLSDSVSTGSSALPHKRNPDIAELIRGRAAAVAGDVTAILTLQKALPMAYNRDLQEDKRIVFHADDTLAASLDAMVLLLDGITFHPPLPDAETVALDLAEALVGRGIPFREAHHVVGQVVARLEEEGRSLDDAGYDDLAAVDDRLTEGDLVILDQETSPSRRVTTGSGSPDSVKAQIDRLRELLA